MKSLHLIAISSISTTIVLGCNSEFGCRNSSNGNANAKANSNSNSYTKFPDGKSTYGFDDGGCYFCSSAPGSPSTLPLSGRSLSDHCRRMCKADSRCVAYTVGRPAVLAANEYFYGKVANCCLEHRHYPSEAYVDATKETILTTMANTTCQHDASCWTRYEKTNQNLGKESSAIDRSITKESPIWPIADTYLRNGEHSTTNYGSEQVLVVKYASKGWTRHSLLQFSDINLLTLSRGRKAKLRLFVVYLDREASRTTSVARMPASFMIDEEISTWENSNPVEATFGDDAVTLSITQDQLYQWVEFDISDLLIDADEMVLSIDNSRSKPTKGNLVAFASKETVYGPRIVFEDYAAPPTPSPSKQ